MNEIITFIFQAFTVAVIVIVLGFALFEFLMEAINDWKTDRDNQRRWDAEWNDKTT